MPRVNAGNFPLGDFREKKKIGDSALAECKLLERELKSDADDVEVAKEVRG